MRRCLRLISLFLLLCPALCQAEEKTEEYSLYIQARGREFTGIWMMNETPDSCMVGTVMNEFGVKAFDFVYSGRKVRLLNVNAFLDKWYIKKVLKKDISFIVPRLSGHQDQSEKKRRITFREDGEIVVMNEKYKIQYIFTPMPDNNETD